MDINQNVNNIIFFKVREVSKTNIEANEELYLNVQPLSYNKNDLSFLEDDTINDDANKFYEDLGDFAVNANSLLFDEEKKIWDDSISEPDKDILFNKLENIIDRKMKLPSQDDEVKPEFFESDYFEDIIKDGYKDYYSNWNALKEVKEKYGDTSLVYNSFLEQWNKDKNKESVERDATDLVKKEFKKFGKKKMK